MKSTNPFDPTEDEQRSISVSTPLSRVARDLEAGHLGHGTYYKYSGSPAEDDDERLPPPQISFSDRGSNRRSENAQNEKTPLCRLKTHPKHRSDQREYEPRQRGLKAFRLVGFWASLVAVALSSSLLLLSIIDLLAPNETAAGFVTSVLGIVVSFVSIVVETVHICVTLNPRWSQWNLGHHTMLHCIISCLCILPLTCNARVIATLFFVHIIPAILFHIAKLRRENTARQLVTEDGG